MPKNKTLRRIFWLENGDARKEWTCSTLGENERNILTLGQETEREDFETYGKMNLGSV
jgi:hypothetical protein